MSNEPDKIIYSMIRVSKRHGQREVLKDISLSYFYGAKIVTGVRVSTLTLDYTREIPLIKYVEANGTAAELPFTTQLTDLIFEQDYFCAVIVYDRTGRACHSAYLTFTAEGDPEGISNDNSAGNLEDNPQ